MHEIIRYMQNYIYPISKIVFVKDYKVDETFGVFTDDKFKCFTAANETDFILATNINIQDLVFENLRLDLELKNQIQVLDNDMFNEFEIISRGIDRHRLTQVLLIKDYRGGGLIAVDELTFCNMMNITDLTLKNSKIVNNLTWAFDKLTAYPTLIDSELYQKFVAPKKGDVDKWLTESERKAFR